MSKISGIIQKDLSEIDILHADVSDEKSLEDMCKSTKLLINCVGPYRFSGEAVVDQCVKNNTHYVDVSGEPQFLESVQLKYFEEAKKRNIYLVGSCGFDSIPCDLGVDFLKKNFPGDLNSVEAYLCTSRAPGSTINFATWQSAIYGLAHAGELKPLRKSLKQNVFPKSVSRADYPMEKRPVLFKSDDVKAWCIPFLGSDKSVVTRTQMFNSQFKNERQVQVETYMRSASLVYALATMFMGAVFMFMTKYVLGRDLLEKYPELFSFGLFSHTPPKRELMAKGSFSIVFKGKGWSEKLAEPTDKHAAPPNKTAKAVLKGPDMGYITTSICVVNAAVTVLKETDKLPLSGGVYTPGAAFGETSILQKLEKRGITISMEAADEN